MNTLEVTSLIVPPTPGPLATKEPEADGDFLRHIERAVDRRDDRVAPKEARTAERRQEGTDDDFAKAVARREDARQVGGHERSPHEADSAAKEDAHAEQAAADPTAEDAPAGHGPQASGQEPSSQAEDRPVPPSSASTFATAAADITQSIGEAPLLVQAVGAAATRPTATPTNTPATTRQTTGDSVLLGAVVEATGALAEELAETLNGETITANAQTDPATPVDPQATAKPDGGSAATVTVLAGEAIRVSRLGNTTDSRATQAAQSSNTATPAEGATQVAAANHGHGGQANGNGNPAPQAQLGSPQSHSHNGSPATGSAGQGLETAFAQVTAHQEADSTAALRLAALAGRPTPAPTTGQAQPAGSQLPSDTPAQAVSSLGAAQPEAAAAREIAQARPMPPRAATHPATMQVAVHVARAASDGVNRISVRLHPAELGRVDVKMEVASDGRVTAMGTAEKSDTLELLQRDSRVLERALQESGLRTDSQSLNFGLRGNERHNDQTAARNGAGSAGGTTDDSLDDGDLMKMPPPRPVSMTDGALDIWV